LVKAANLPNGIKKHKKISLLDEQDIETQNFDIGLNDKRKSHML